jgi:hypothetical protein
MPVFFPAHGATLPCSYCSWGPMKHLWCLTIAQNASYKCFQSSALSLESLTRDAVYAALDRQQGWVFNTSLAGMCRTNIQCFQQLVLQADVPQEHL